jgi:hypothetical protein
VAGLRVLDSGDIDLDRFFELDAAEALRSDLVVALKTLRGSYAADLAAGLDPALLTGPLTWLQQVEADVLAVARRVPGVRSVEIIAQTYDGPTRTPTFVLRVNGASSFTLQV